MAEKTSRTVGRRTSDWTNGLPILNERQFIPASVHKTPPAVMKLPLPRRINTLIKMHARR